MRSFHSTECKIRFSQFIDKFLKFKGMEFLNLFDKFNVTTSIFCEFPILFSTVKLKLGYAFSQFMRKFKIWISKCWSWAILLPSFLQFMKEMQNWDFWGLAYNHFHNILRLFDVLQNFYLTTSETMRDYYL